MARALPLYLALLFAILTVAGIATLYLLRAKVIVMAIVGALTYLALLAIGVPFAVPLAIVVAFGELIPRAGRRVHRGARGRDRRHRRPRRRRPLAAGTAGVVRSFAPCGKIPGPGVHTRTDVD